MHTLKIAHNQKKYYIQTYNLKDYLQKIVKHFTMLCRFFFTNKNEVLIHVNV